MHGHFTIEVCDSSITFSIERNPAHEALHHQECASKLKTLTPHKAQKQPAAKSMRWCCELHERQLRRDVRSRATAQYILEITTSVDVAGLQP